MLSWWVFRTKSGKIWHVKLQSTVVACIVTFTALEGEMSF
jgi:hypothetical protein